VRGAADVQVETLTGKPVLTLQVDRAAARFGLSVTEVLEVVQAGLGGEAVSTLIDGTRRYEIVVRFAEGARSTIEDILRIPLRTAEGGTWSPSRR
jgi:cobalt-zinc-cadmium resistance protein CzcA